MSRRWRLTPVVVLLLVVLAGCATLGMESIASLLEQGKALLEAKKYDEALAKFQDVIKRDPASWQAYLYSARAYIGKGAWAPAIDSGRKALQLAPSGQDVAGVLGEALVGGGRDSLARGQYAEAIGRFVDYLKLKPTDAHAYLDLGRAYLGSRRYADAVNSLLRGLAQPGDATVRQDLVATLLAGGRQALAAGDAQSAVSALKEYVQRDPGAVSAYLDLGKAYWQGGQRGEALDAFRRVLQLQPQNEEALRFLLGR